MIEARNLSLTLGGRQVLTDISLSISPGELTVVIGPNGSGKTSLITALSGHGKSSGDVLLDARSLRHWHPRDLAARRAVMSQSTTLGFPFTVNEVVTMGLEAGFGPGKRAAEEILDDALEAVDLAGFGNRIATQLSGGEQARMHMARALCQVPFPERDGKASWLLLDEPVASLDIRHQLALLSAADRFARAGGGVIAILHDLNLTAMFADRVIMLSRGRVIADGAVAEVMTSANLEKLFGHPMLVTPAVGAIPAQIRPVFERVT